MTNVVIGNGVTSIGGGAFYECYALADVVIGSGVTSIGGGAFGYCRALASVYITDLSAWCKISMSSSPLVYGAKLYLNNNLVTELTIPDDVTEIKSYTFTRYGSITKVTIPDHVISISTDAFRECNSLKDVVIGDGVTSIGSDAFCDCDALTSVVIGDACTTISKNAFYDCDVLTKVSIGSGITTIVERAFKFCPLTEFYCYATTPPSPNCYSAFSGTSNDATLYVPTGCSNKYKDASWSKHFTNIVEMNQ